MAKKSRTPPPPRRVQAPRARAGDRDPKEGRRSLWMLLGVAGAVAVAAAVGVALLAFGGSTPARDVLEEAGCTLESVPVRYAQVDGARQQHMEALPEDYEYDTFPGVAGTHHPQQAPLDFYNDPVDQIRVVHNQEHGAIVIRYGRAVPQTEIQAMQNWYRENPNGLLVAPLPALDDQISLGAWTAEFDSTGTRVTNEQGHLAKCTRFDPDAFDAFVDEYGFQGPERATRDQLPPGGG